MHCSKCVLLATCANVQTERQPVTKHGCRYIWTSMQQLGEPSCSGTIAGSVMPTERRRSSATGARRHSAVQQQGQREHLQHQHIAQLSACSANRDVATGLRTRAPAMLDDHLGSQAMGYQIADVANLAATHAKLLSNDGMPRDVVEPAGAHVAVTVSMEGCDLSGRLRLPTASKTDQPTLCGGKSKVSIHSACQC